MAAQDTNESLLKRGPAGHFRDPWFAALRNRCYAKRRRAATNLKVHPETTVISHLTSRLSRALMTAARQQATQDGSETSLATCELAVSQFLLDEPGADDADRATERFAPLGSIPLLDATPDAPESARALMESHLIPPRNETDAAHTAAATVHNMQFLLTWNCTYLANAEISARLQVIRAKLHHAALIVRSPEALLGAR